MKKQLAAPALLMCLAISNAALARPSPPFGTFRIVGVEIDRNLTRTPAVGRNDPGELHHNFSFSPARITSNSRSDPTACKSPTYRFIAGSAGDLFQRAFGKPDEVGRLRPEDYGLPLSSAQATSGFSITCANLGTEVWATLIALPDGRWLMPRPDSDGQVLILSRR